MKEIISTPDTFSARIQVLDFTDHLVKMKSSFKVSIFTFSRIMQYDLLSHNITFHIMSSQSVASYHNNLMIIRRPKRIVDPEAHLLLLSHWRWCNTRNYLFHISFISLTIYSLFHFNQEIPFLWEARPFKSSWLFLSA